MAIWYNCSAPRSQAIPPRKVGKAPALRRRTHSNADSPVKDEVSMATRNEGADTQDRDTYTLKPYTPPCVEEDLPLETQSLACDQPGIKELGACANEPILS